MKNFRFAKIFIVYYFFQGHISTGLGMFLTVLQQIILILS